MLTDREKELLVTVQKGGIPEEHLDEARNFATRIVLSRATCQEVEDMVATLGQRPGRLVGLFFHQLRKCSVVEMDGPLSPEEKWAMSPLDEFHPGLHERAKKRLGRPDILALLQNPTSGQAEMEAALDDQATFNAAVRREAVKQGIDLDAMVAQIPPHVLEELQQEVREDPRLLEE